MHTHVRHIFCSTINFHVNVYARYVRRFYYDQNADDYKIRKPLLLRMFIITLNSTVDSIADVGCVPLSRFNWNLIETNSRGYT